MQISRRADACVGGIDGLLAHLGHGAGPDLILLSISSDMLLCTRADRRPATSISLGAPAAPSCHMAPAHFFQSTICGIRAAA